jgi:hypothetical protein
MRGEFLFIETNFFWGSKDRESNKVEVSEIKIE